MQIHVSVSKQVADQSFLLSSLKLLIDAGFQVESCNVHSGSVGQVGGYNQAIAAQQSQPVSSGDPRPEPTPEKESPKDTPRAAGRPAKAKPAAAEAAPPPAAEPPAPAPAPLVEDETAIDDRRLAIRSHLSAYIQAGGGAQSAERSLQVNQFLLGHPRNPANIAGSDAQPWRKIDHIAKIADAEAVLADALKGFPVAADNPSVL